MTASPPMPISTANELFWLGRYLVRIDGLSRLLPFENDEAAQVFAHAFCLPAWNASSLNELLSDPYQPSSLTANLDAIYQNVQSVRGVIKQVTFELFNQLRHSDSDDRQHLLELVASCRFYLGDEVRAVRSFWQLGEAVERVDIGVRLEHEVVEALALLQAVLLEDPLALWHELGAPAAALMVAPDEPSLYAFCDQLYAIFESGPCVQQDVA